MGRFDPVSQSRVVELASCREDAAGLSFWRHELGWFGPRLSTEEARLVATVMSGLGAEAVRAIHPEVRRVSISAAQVDEGWAASAQRAVLWCFGEAARVEAELGARFVDAVGGGAPVNELRLMARADAVVASRGREGQVLRVYARALDGAEFTARVRAAAEGLNLETRVVPYLIS